MLELVARRMFQACTLTVLLFIYRCVVVPLFIFLLAKIRAFI